MVSIDTRQMYPYIDVTIKIGDVVAELGLLDKDDIKTLYTELQSELEYLSRYIEED